MTEKELKEKLAEYEKELKKYKSELELEKLKSEYSEYKSKLREVQQRKIPGLAAFLSLIIPGLGQIYNGEILKGIVYFTTAFLFIVIGKESATGIVAIIDIISAIDAYRSARRINKDIHDKK